jgi:pimeloyl-ACP methyl ester carboxylesterase
MSVRDITLQAGSLRLAARVWGEEGGQRVLALHGWLDNAASFVPLAAELDGIQLVALELAGHGHSAHRPPGSAYHFVDNIPDVLAAADALGWERFTLLGHSLGAGVASFTAAAAPGRIEQLLLIEGLGPLSGVPADEAHRLQRYLRQHVSQGKRRRRRYPSLEAAAAQRAAKGGLSSAAARLLAGRGTEVQGGEEVSWRHDPRLIFTSPHYYTEEQVLAVLQAVEVPTVLVMAEEGLLQRRPTTAGRCAALANLKVVHLPGGHHLHMENPAAVAAALGAFLDADEQGSWDDTDRADHTRGGGGGSGVGHQSTQGKVSRN